MPAENEFSGVVSSIQTPDGSLFKIKDSDVPLYMAGENISIDEIDPLGQYQLLESAVNASSTRIDTGVTTYNDDVEFYIRFKQTAIGLLRLFGAQTGDAVRYWIGFFGNTNNYITLTCRSSSYLTSDITRTVNHVYTLKGTMKDGNAALYVKDETTGETDLKTGTYDVDTSYAPPIRLFYSSNSDAYQVAGTHVYQAMLKVKGKTVLNYVPMKRKSDDAVGFIDTVSGSFVTATSGSFSAGEDSKAKAYVVSSDDGVLYGETSTAAATADKVVYTSNGKLILKKGVVVNVKFVSGNTAAAPTLIFDNGSAIAIKTYGTTSPASKWPANCVVSFVYDGTYWRVIDADNYNKADKVSNATNGNFAGLDSNGNLTDSGHKHGDYVTSLGTSGNNVTWTKNGSTNNLTVPFATNAGTAAKLGSSTVGGSMTRPIYLNSGTPVAITKLAMDYFGWPHDAYSSLDSVSNLYLNAGANVCAHIKPDYVDVEYTNDNGVTWLDYGATNEQKVKTFTTSNTFSVGKKSTSSSTNVTVNDAVRITVHSGAGFYCHSLFMLLRFYCPALCTLKLEYTTYSATTTWVEHGTYNVGGNPTYLMVPFDKYIFGNNSVHDFRLTLQYAGTGYTTSAHGINMIKIFSNNIYSANSSLAKTGHLYSYDWEQNADFPANVTASKFIKSGGTSSQFLKADGSVDSNTYLTSAPIETASIGPGGQYFGINLATNKQEHRQIYFTNINKAGVYLVTCDLGLFNEGKDDTVIDVGLYYGYANIDSKALSDVLPHKVHHVFAPSEQSSSSFMIGVFALTNIVSDSAIYIGFGFTSKEYIDIRGFYTTEADGIRESMIGIYRLGDVGQSNTITSSESLVEDKFLPT